LFGTVGNTSLDGNCFNLTINTNQLKLNILSLIKMCQTIYLAAYTLQYNHWCKNNFKGSEKQGYQNKYIE